MNGYVAHYNGRRVEVHADTLLEAKDKACAALKVRPSQRHMVAVMLAEKDGAPVVHTPDF